MKAQIINAECLDALRDMPDNSVDSIVTDPPYGLSFMGKKWDYDVPGVEVWRECLRVLKPGGHLLAFAGTRTQHRMAVNIEDAGFEIRDMIAWVYGSGFPKSHDIAKAIDRAKGGSVEGRESPEAKQWGGWGTALKPSLEPITVARKPFTGTVAANVLKHGTGGLNIDGCRIGAEEIKTNGGNKFPKLYGKFNRCEQSTHIGRFPANLIHDGSEGVEALFPETTPSKKREISEQEDIKIKNKIYGKGYIRQEGGLNDNGGSASRFFYCAKASKEDREYGLDQEKANKVLAQSNQAKAQAKRGIQHQTESFGINTVKRVKNNHPTVKPIDLMRYLCRLVTPPNGLVLDPFAGSGTTGIAATLEGFQFTGIEREAEYCEMANTRIQYAISKAKEGKEPRTPDEVKRTGGQLSILDEL